MNHPKLGLDTMVIVERTVKAFGDRNEHGPKTIAQAIKDGDLSTSSGTVSVAVTVADGPHEGANAYQSRDGVWRAQYNPVLEFPNRAPRD